MILNCIDNLYLPKDKNKIAFIWEGDNPEESKNITYQDLHDEVCKFSNVLNWSKKGDRGCIYMPMIRKPHMRCWLVQEVEQYIL